MILVGIDDTDTPDSPGTNQLCRDLVARLAPRYEVRFIVRHQLLEDPQIPATTHNGAASLWLDPAGEAESLPASAGPEPWLVAELRAAIREWAAEGSNPGLCIATAPPAAEVSQFGRRCQEAVVPADDARAIAAQHGLHLEGVGGSEGGVIGALAAVGLAQTADDGRVVYDYVTQNQLSGTHAIADLANLGIEVRRLVSQELVREGSIDLGEHLRPNLRGGQIVLYAAQGKKKGQWLAFRVP